MEVIKREKSCFPNVTDLKLYLIVVYLFIYKFGRLLPSPIGCRFKYKTINYINIIL